MYGRSVVGTQHVRDVDSHVLAGIKPPSISLPRGRGLCQEVCHVHATQSDRWPAW